MGPIISLLSSSAGGALFRLLLQWLNRRFAASENQKDRDAENVIAARGHIVDYAKAIGQTAGAKMVPAKWRIKLLWGLFDFESNRRRFVSPASARTRANNLSLFMLTFTVCLCTWIYVAGPSETLATFDPNDRGVQWGLFFGFFTWSSTAKDVVILTTQGVGFLLLHPLIFIVTALLTGIDTSAPRR